MKIILSRKGFDSSNGGCPNPVFPDGTLLSLPIPSEDKTSYADLIYRGVDYETLLSQLNPKVTYSHCHLDPDIRPDIRRQPIPQWKPAIGQINQAQIYLKNAGIEEGDLFLFFGRYKKVRKTNDGTWKFDPGSSIKHIIYGYLQVGEILTKPEDINEYYWHPHADESRINNAANALYFPRRTLSFNSEAAGCGVFEYDERRVLTMPGCNTATWKDYPFLMPERF